jgi:arylsulfatase A-like enzyme
MIAGTGLLMILALTGSTAQCAPANVVLIVVDTLRQDHLGCYGYERPTSPSIDRLAAVATRYENAFSQAPWTTPSIASLLTSQYPSALGITQEPDRLDDRFVLLSEVLSDHGYFTAAVISHYFLKSKWNLDQGFDVYDESSIMGHGGVSSAKVTDTAIELIRANKSRPIFLLVHYFDPHYDYLEHEGFVFSGDLDYSGRLSSVTSYDQLRPLIRTLDERDLEYLRALYDSEIAFTDAHIGRLLDELQALGLFDSSIIILTADHGEELRERHTVGHGGTLFNEQINIPLLIKYPGSNRSTAVSSPVGLVDLLPTLLDYLDLPVEHEIAGSSLLSESARPVFSETSWGGYRSVIRDQLKLIHHIDSRRYQLFDLDQDPGERDDLLARPFAPELPMIDQLREELQGWAEAVKVESLQAEEVSLSDRERMELAALGYLQPGANPARERSVLVEAAHRQTRGDTFQVSDLQVFNQTYTSRKLRLSFTRFGDRTSVSVEIEVEPRQLKLLGDVVQSSFGTTGAGIIEIEAGAEMVVGQRTYSRSPEGTYGGYITVQQPRTGAHYLAVPCSETLRAHLGIAPAAGEKVRVSSDIAPLQPESEITTPVRVEVPCSAGSMAGQVSATEPLVVSASLTDSINGDLSFYPGADLHRHGILAGLAHVAGERGSAWQSDAFFHAPSGAAIELWYVPFDTDLLQVSSQKYRLAEGETLVLEDVVGQLGQGDSAGVLVFSTAAEIAAAARTYTLHRDGHPGQAIRPVVSSDYVEPGESAYLLFFAESSSYTCNLALINPDKETNVIKVMLAGTDASETFRVPARSALQKNRIARLLGAGKVENGVLIVTGKRPFTTYMSLVDRGTGDPSMVTPVVRHQPQQPAKESVQPAVAPGSDGFPVADLVKPWWTLDQIRQALTEKLTWKLIAALMAAMTIVQLAVLLLARGLGLRLQRRVIVLGLALPLLVLSPWILGGKVLLPTSVVKSALPMSPDIESSDTHRLLNDPVLQMLPWEMEVRRALADGHLPLWSDRLEGGSSPLGNPQACPLCPVAMISRLAPIEHHLLVALALKMLLAFQGMWLLARLLGGGRIASLLAACGYSMAGGLTAWALFPHSTAAAWAPWLTVATIRLVRHPRAVRLATTALITAALLLAGHPEVAFGAGLLAAVCGTSFYSRRTGFWRGFGAAAAAAALGVGLAAVHLLPFMHMLQHSQRLEQTMAEEHEVEPIVWSQLDTWFTTGFYNTSPSIVNPMAAGRPFAKRSSIWVFRGCLYAGLLTFAGTVVCLFSLRRRLVPLVVFAGVGLLFVMSFTPLKLIILSVPLLKSYACLRMQLIVTLCMCACAALGLTRMLRRDHRVTVWIALAIAATVSLVAAPTMSVVLLWVMIVGSAVVARCRPRWAEIVLCLVLLADLLPWARAVLPVGETELFYPKTTATEVINDKLKDGPWRVVGRATFCYPAMLSVYGIEDIRYHNPMARTDYAHVLAAACDFHAGEWQYISAFRNLDHPLLDFLGVRLVASRLRLPTKTLVDVTATDLKKMRLYLNPNALPRFFIPEGVDVVPEPAVVQQVAEMSNPRRVVVAEGDLGSWAPPQQKRDRSAVAIEASSSGRYLLRLTPGQQRLLATSLPFPEGWKASADSQRLSTVTINGAFLGVIVPAGAEVVELRFVPPGLYLGLIGFSVSLLVVIGLPVVARRRER